MTNPCANSSAAALLQLAAELSPDLAREIPAMAEGGSGDVEITPADRHAAATEAYSLALRRAEGTAAHQQEAVQAYDIALALHYESYWAYSKGLLQDLGETDAACAMLEAVQGYYESSARQVATQFRRQAAGGRRG